MYWNTLIKLLIIVFYERCSFASSISVCFTKENPPKWCQNEISLCKNRTVAHNISVIVESFTGAGNTQCEASCKDTTKKIVSFISSDFLKPCNGNVTCSLVNIPVPDYHQGGMLTLSFSCKNAATASVSNSSKSTTSTFVTNAPGLTTTNSYNTIESSTPTNIPLYGPRGSDNSPHPHTAAIVVSVVILVVIVVLVVAIILFRRGQCKKPFGQCSKTCDKHSPDRTDAFVMDSTANAYPTYNLSSDIDVNSCGVDYCGIDKVGKKEGVEYNHVDLKKQAVLDSTYNHIGHLNRSPDNTEQTYNHVGDEMFQKNYSSTLQPDMYSHIGSMAKPTPEQLAEDSYAHINGVNKDLPTAYKMNQYDCADFQSNGGQTGKSGHRGNEIKSGKENKFIVVGPNKMDMSSDAPVSRSYFVLEKHEKEA